MSDYAIEGRSKIPCTEATGGPVTAADHADAKSQERDEAATALAQQAEKLGLLKPEQENEGTGSTRAVEAKFITGQDAVLVTANGGRLPAVPIDEAAKLNTYKEMLEARGSKSREAQFQKRGITDGRWHGKDINSGSSKRPKRLDAPLREASPPLQTNPLFPPLPVYGSPTFLRNVQCLFFRTSSAILSFAFLLVVVLGALFTAIPTVVKNIGMLLKGAKPETRRPFSKEEQRRRRTRKETEAAWNQKRRRRKNRSQMDAQEEDAGDEKTDFIPTEGGSDPLVSDISYYARRGGLDAEEFRVQTEDGFIIPLWHVYNPHEYQPRPPKARESIAPSIFPDDLVRNSCSNRGPESRHPDGDRRYPVLLLHGLLQSAGAYCCNDDDSLAFYLCKAGYDVWLGTNRCGFNPEHNLLTYGDPRMWAWNIRQMGVLDLPALISRTLLETGFPKLGLICHSQGTTQTFVALAKEQRPDIGSKISVSCALAPAAYAGPLIGKMYFKFMRAISPMMFRLIFGIHAFIPFMMTMHSILPRRLYGFMGYRVFSFLFNWTDERWDRGLRDRMFQFSPTYVSSESMRWWLGRECFAKQKCILATRQIVRIEDEEDKQDASNLGSHETGAMTGSESEKRTRAKDRGRFAWYDERAPPMAFWVAGNDDLVDGRRLLRRFEHGREPHVRVVHKKVIEGYEHLDVIWAMDAIEKVGSEIKEVVWRTVDGESRRMCRVPFGCEALDFISEKKDRVNGQESEAEEAGAALIDSTAGARAQQAKEDRVFEGGDTSNRPKISSGEEVADKAS